MLLVIDNGKYRPIVVSIDDEDKDFLGEKISGDDLSSLEMAEDSDEMSTAPSMVTQKFPDPWQLPNSSSNVRSDLYEVQKVKCCQSATEESAGRSVAHDIGENGGTGKSIVSGILASSSLLHTEGMG